MAYLQITTRCTMKCAHCCYSCGKNGKHMNYNNVIDAIDFIANKLGNEGISIGGGEPTLHPEFFNILEYCLDNFDYVWMATNGSKTKSMYRLANILNGYDFENCSCETNEEKDYCQCQIIDGTDKLTVALSQDYFHDEIDERIVSLWTRNANVHKRSGYEIRNVTSSRQGIVKEGRAKRTGNYQDEDGCCCSDIVIKPNGGLRLCGCSIAPVIGDIWSGIQEKWQDIIDNNKDYQETKCSKSLPKKLLKGEIDGTAFVMP